jgi:hypothetical protein
VLEHRIYWLVCLSSLGSSGCSRAPSIEILGTFLPSWMFCVVAAIVATGLLRWQLARRDLEKRIPALAVFYPSVVVALTCLLWLILFA